MFEKSYSYLHIKSLKNQLWKEIGDCILLIYTKTSKIYIRKKLPTISTMKIIIQPELNRKKSYALRILRLITRDKTFPI